MSPFTHNSSWPECQGWVSKGWGEACAVLGFDRHPLWQSGHVLPYNTQAGGGRQGRPLFAPAGLSSMWLLSGGRPPATSARLSPGVLIHAQGALAVDGSCYTHHHENEPIVDTTGKQHIYTWFWVDCGFRVWAILYLHKSTWTCPLHKQVKTEVVWLLNVCLAWRGKTWASAETANCINGHCCWSCYIQSVGFVQLQVLSYFNPGNILLLHLKENGGTRCIPVVWLQNEAKMDQTQITCGI